MNLQRCHLATETLGCSVVAIELSGGSARPDNSVPQTFSSVKLFTQTYLWDSTFPTILL